jgi:hypothetical protein
MEGCRKWPGAARFGRRPWLTFSCSDAVLGGSNRTMLGTNSTSITRASSQSGRQRFLPTRLTHSLEVAQIAGGVRRQFATTYRDHAQPHPDLGVLPRPRASPVRSWRRGPTELLHAGRRRLRRQRADAANPCQAGELLAGTRRGPHAPRHDRRLSPEDL